MNRSEPALHLNEIDVNDKYNFIKLIGKGSYGEVWLVVALRHSASIKSTSKQHVLKRLDLRQQSNSTTQNDIDGAEREAKLLSTLKHPNIVSYIESFRSNDGFLNIVMAYCEGGDLYTKLKERKANKEPLAENQIVEWFVQICMALQYMHDKSILHRDLKTQNIFLTKNEIVKVGDLGIARVLDSGNDLATTIIGTPYYMSPEIFSNKPYGQKSDIWALGCCVFEMTTLEHAFNAKDMNSLVLKIIRGQMPQTSKRYSEPLTAIIKSMLSKDPIARPTAKKILQNPYIKRHIMQLLEKTKKKCENQSNIDPPPPPSSTGIAVVTPLPSSSAPTDVSIPPSLNGAKVPHTSAKSPSPKKAPSSRLSHNGNSNAPVLPSYPYPPLPPTHNRVQSNVTTSSSGSSSSADASRSLPSTDSALSSDPRARRRLRARQSNASSVPTNEQQTDLKYLVKLTQNDTIQRRRRDQQITNHVKHHQPWSSEDEHEPSIVQPSAVAALPKKLTRPSSAASSIESNHSKHSFDDENYFNEHSSHASARQRRRESRIQSSIESVTPVATPNNIIRDLSRSASQDSVSTEITKKQEGEKDMNDLLFMLTATLKLLPVAVPSASSSSANAQESELDMNELTQSSNDSDKTIVDPGHSTPPYPEPNSQLWTPADRTMEAPLYQTNRLDQQYQKFKENCLREISPDRLRRILDIMDRVGEAQMTSKMIDELGEELYEKYSADIFLLKFYEESLHARS